jgi:sulfate/thiosulfate-binding protein
MFKLITTLSVLVVSVVTTLVRADEVELFNTSYDVPRRFYEEYNPLFARHWKAKTGQDVKFKVSFGPSGKQGRAVIDGNGADVVTLALANDIIAISEKGKLIDPGWEKELPENSSPYTSTIIFLVRKGNPKGVKDWPDLIKDGVEVLTPNPKTGGNPRWAYLAAWGSVTQRGGSEDDARKFITEFYKHVPVLDEGARASLTSFAKREIGDVLLAWENEAHLALDEFGADKFEIVYPPISILAEPSVAVVDKNVDKKGTRAVAEEFLKYLYSDEARELEVKHNFRPRDPQLAAKHKGKFPPIKLFTIDEVFGGWPKAQATHFAAGGVFEQIYQPGAK